MKHLFAVAVLALSTGAAQASTESVAMVEISEQRMVVAVDGKALHQWDVSTARPGKTTPTGIYGVQWLSARHKSSLYNNAPMPFAVFFHGGYAVHATNEISRLGRPASHGCIRLHPKNASKFYNLVEKAGLSNTRVIIKH